MHAVKYVYERSSEVVIGVGSALESHTPRNPFTAAERIEMILLGLEEMGLPREKFLIIPIPDAPYHRQWVPIVEVLVPRFDVVYSNEPLTRTLFIEAGYRVESIPMLRREVYSGEEFRRRVLEGGDWREIVCDSVARYLVDRGLIDRIVRMAKTDKPGGV
jgi:nicotinamide-nucleotide adenylyltransferase